MSYRVEQTDPLTLLSELPSSTLVVLSLVLGVLVKG
jgi:hypothetical protein